MSQEVSELVFEKPAAATLRDLARVVSGRRVELESVRLRGDAPTLREILVRCSDGDVRLNDEGAPEASRSDKQSSGIRFSVAPDRERKLDTSAPDPPSGSRPVANGGRATAHLVEESLPERDGYASTGEWVADTAERIGLDSDSLLEIAAAVNEGERAAQVRHLLELAFRQHLDRPNKGGRGYVEIRTSTASSVGHYHYLDNGRGRGGAHYFRGLTHGMRETIRRIAIEEDLTVLAEGEAYVSVSFERLDVVADVGFAEKILLSAFEVSLADIVAIEEFIGREVACSWIN